MAEELDLADGRAVHADEFLFHEGFRLLMPFQEPPIDFSIQEHKVFHLGVADIA